MLRATHSLTVRAASTDPMTSGPDELHDPDAAELLGVGSRALAVRVCRVAQLVRVIP
jgi:hypothetical protein